MNRQLTPLVLLVLAACGGAPEVGTFRIEAREEGGFRVVSRNGDRVLLESASATEAPYAPVAARKNKARYELSYGSFRITEGNEPWTTGARLELQKDGARITGRFVQEDGTQVATLNAESPSEGVLLLRVTAAAEDANRMSLAFACSAEDRFLGFGSQSDGVDHRGHKIPIWTSEPGIGKSEGDDPPDLWMLEGARHGASYGLPTWLSNRGFVGAVDSDARSVFELCSEREDAWRIEVSERELRLHVYDGPSPKQALERATGGILGRPMRPPPVAFAPWNDAIFGSQSVRDVAKLLRERNIPSSVLWTEDFRGGEDRSGQGYRLIEEWDLDRNLYPDAEALAAELRADGFSWHAYFNTFVVEGTRIWDASVAGDHLVRTADGAPYKFDGVTFKPTGLADLSRAETREFVKTYLRAALDAGFDGWMADYGEWLPHDAKLHSGEDPLLAHNRYAKEWAKVNAEVMAEYAQTGRELLFFSRAGWFGQTSFTPVVWAGDQRTDFQQDDGLPTVIPMGLNFGLAGISTYGHDIAGYQSATNPASTKELFFRWTTLGALSPVMRTHHGIKARDNWWFGKDEETIQHYARWASFHLRLFPYLDGASVEAETRGLPLMRSLALEFPEEPASWTLADQFLLGPSLLVAPVVAEGATARSVHLPAGRWWPLEGGAAHEGPSNLDVSAPVTEIPIFGRAGGVVPLLQEGIQTLLPSTTVPSLHDTPPARVVLVFTGAAGSFLERDGTLHVLEHDGGEADGFRENGAALGECTSTGQRGCVEPAAAGRPVRVRLAGNQLSFAGHRFRSEGPTRQTDVLVYR